MGPSARSAHAFHARLALGVACGLRWREDTVVAGRQTRTTGLMMTVVGLAVIVYAVVLVGFTEDGGGTDWVSIVTAIAGGVIAATGIYTLFRRPGPKLT